MNIFGRASIEVPILVKIWHQDGVWNFSAFDVPIVSYGDNVEDARKNFEEAVVNHLEALRHFGSLRQTVERLQAIAKERDFYSARIEPREMVSQFPISFTPEAELQLCGV